MDIICDVIKDQEKYKIYKYLKENFAIYLREVRNNIQNNIILDKNVLKSFKEPSADSFDNSNINNRFFNDTFWNQTAQLRFTRDLFSKEFWQEVEKKYIEYLKNIGCWIDANKQEIIEDLI